MLSLKQDALRVVRGKPNTGIIVVPLQGIFDAEARIPEIAALTPHKAPELLSAFNAAFLEVDGFVKQIEMELTVAKQHQNVVKSIVLLDKSDQILKDKGLKASADLRQAVVEVDPDYQAATERVNALEAAREYVKGKARGMEMAYSSVKKLIGEVVHNRSVGNRTSLLNGTMPEEEIVPF